MDARFGTGYTYKFLFTINGTRPKKEKTDRKKLRLTNRTMQANEREL